MSDFAVYMDWDGSGYGANGKYAFFCLERDMVYVKNVRYNTGRYTLPDVTPILGYNLRTGEVNRYNGKKNTDVLESLKDLLKSMKIAVSAPEETI